MLTSNKKKKKEKKTKKQCVLLSLFPVPDFDKVLTRYDRKIVTRMNVNPNFLWRTNGGK